MTVMGVAYWAVSDHTPLHPTVVSKPIWLFVIEILRDSFGLGFLFQMYQWCSVCPSLGFIITPDPSLSTPDCRACPASDRQ